MPLARADSGINATAPDWSRGGVITFSSTTPSNASDLWILPLSGGRTPVVFLSSKHTEAMGLSPDGRWIRVQLERLGP